ncbi:MAG: outer membrane beta-barrel protein [Bacteroidales bacterium]|nr:outer membrane beta-barrel protein [Bacteroidales bacterium]
MYSEKNFISKYVGYISFNKHLVWPEPVSYRKPTKKTSFWYGPKVGIDLITPTIDQGEIEAQFKSNYSAGFFLQFGRKLYIQPEFYYVVQNEPIFENGEQTSDGTTVNSLRIPLMLGIKLIDLGIVSAHIIGGPTATFFLNESNPIDTNPREDYSFALQFGAGADVLGFITLDIHYSFDLGENLEEQANQFT